VLAFLLSQLACPKGMEGLEPFARRIGVAAFHRIREERERALALPLGRKLSLIMSHVDYPHREEVWRAMQAQRELVESLAVAVVVGDMLGRSLGMGKVVIGKHRYGAYYKGGRVNISYTFALRYPVTDVTAHEWLHGYGERFYRSVGNEMIPALSICFSGMGPERQYQLFVKGKAHPQLVLFYLLHPFVKSILYTLPKGEEQRLFGEEGVSRRVAVELFTRPLPWDRERADSAAALLLQLIAPESLWVNWEGVHRVVASALSTAPNLKYFLIFVHGGAGELAKREGIPYRVPAPFPSPLDRVGEGEAQGER